MISDSFSSVVNGPALDQALEELANAGLLDAPMLDRGRRAAEQTGARLDHALNRLGLVSDDALLSAWSAVSGVKSATAIDFPEIADLGSLSSAFLRHARCVPLSIAEDVMLLAVEDPLDGFAPAAVAARTGLRVERRLACASDIDAWLKALPDDIDLGEQPTTGDDLTADVEQLRDRASDAPIVRLVHDLIDRAIETRASDIHLTASRSGSRLRYRIDGMLRDDPPPTAGLHAPVVSRFKIMAGLDIAERRLPQDGRIRIGSRGQEIDLRVSTMPHAHGEGVVLRVLDRSAVALEFAALGLSDKVVAPLRTALKSPHGLILVTGPTGSGKTTTLCAALKEISGPDRNIVTVEDPIEHHLEGVNQIQVARKVGLDFAGALRAVLRQDPDVVMVGEIRDRETAAVAIQAALTGHLVLATLHTNTAAAALPRLVDMGVEPYLVASTVRGVMAQRLVRRLCPKCCSETPIDLRMAAAAGLTDIHNLSAQQGGFEAIGCGGCGGSGYDGRIAIAEFMPMTERIQDRLLDAPDERAVARAATEDGMIGLRQDGFAKVLAGATTLAELVRVTGVL